MFAVLTYLALLVGAAACTYAGCLAVAIALGAAALVVAWRYEIRWLADHTKLTRHEPRPVPRHGPRLHR